MVTFSIPGDGDVPEPTATPRSRPPLPFAKRAYAASSPYGTGPRHHASPHAVSARKTLTTRDDAPASSLGRSYAGASNLFRTSTVSDSPPAATPFSPSFSQTPMKKVFAPGATPEPSRVQRESTAHATPRGVAARAKEKDLFTMRIASPPRELTGEVLTQKVPKDWDPRGSIYADQFLGHLCPPDLDDEQRRQFFCILDLRRLKYAADEIFCKKGWKLNVINFAKEFEKSRSIILLHYGLYEFQNVKPSKDLIRRWRREHGLPPLEDDDEQESATPSKPTMSTKKKRKALDDGRDETQSSSSLGKTKRRATDNEDAVGAPAALPAPPAPAAPTPVLGKNKRRASDSDDEDAQPAKMQKQPSSARSLFEKAANKASSTPAGSPSKPNLFSPAPSKPVGSGDSLFQSVLKNNAKSDAAAAASAQKSSSGNIFGHLSDNSSGKNSGQEADAESETDSEVEAAEDAQDDEPRAKRPAVASNAETSSDAATRESTPGRSLFDRVSKNGDGESTHADTSAPAPPTPAPVKDQTWNPSTTPIKFAPAPTPAASQGSSLFGNSGAAASTGSSLFGQKAMPPTSNLFGAPKPAEPQTNGAAAEEADKDDGESDKENDSQAPNKPETKPGESQPSFGSSLFQPKPAAPEAPKEAEPAKPASTSNLFGAPTNTPSPVPATSNMFGKPAESTPAAAPVMKSSTLFGAKPSEPAKQPETSEPEKPAPIFGAPASTNGTASGSSLFGAKPAAATGGGLFGNTAPAAASPAKPLFGNAASTDGAAASTSAPTFSFGGAPASGLKENGAAEAPAKPLFGAVAPKSPPAVAGAGSMFDGSPMKQDDKPAAKPLFGAGSNGGANTSASASAPIFSFGNQSQNGPTSNLFGGASTSAPANTGSSGGGIFGGAAGTNSGSSAPASNGGFSFNVGGGSTPGSSFSNPFASSSSGDNKPAEPAAPGGMFNFGGNQSNGGANGGSPFQFGSGSSNAGPSGGIFGGSSQASNTNGAPIFGAGSSTPSSGPGFSFGGAPSQPQNAAPVFNLQPPSGGPSTGTNTPSNLGGGSSLATTPAHGTPEPSCSTDTAAAKPTGGDEEGEKHEQVNLAEQAEEGEEVLHEVRAKVLKFTPADKVDGDKPKPKSPWAVQGVGQLRLLKNEETSVVRLLLRAEPRGNIAINRAVLPDMDHKADEKYVKVTTANESGDGLETWMIQVKTKDLAKALAEAVEANKAANKK